MGKIERYEVHEEWNHSGLVKAGDYCFLSYCAGNIGGTTEEQINRKYPARKSIQTDFAHVGGPDGLHFQADTVR